MSTEKALSALREETKSPEWLCRMVLEACSGDVDGAMCMGGWFARYCGLRWKEPEDTLKERVRRLIYIWHVAREKGADQARANLREGTVVELSFGLIRDILLTCPVCMMRWSFGFSASLSEPEACMTCGAPLVRLVSTGCMVGEDTLPYVEGHNAVVEDYLKANFNPDFSWKRVRDVGS